MDFVVGNPPYIRIHNLDRENDYSSFDFSRPGMTDIYILFFELGINMLNEKGKLSYITPDSYQRSVFGRKLRKYIVENNMLKSIYELGHYNPFKPFTVYTTITTLEKRGKNKIVFYKFESENKFNIIDSFAEYDFFIDEKFYICKHKELIEYKPILTYNSKKYVIVKNGLATLMDSFFINNEYKGKLITDIYKCSTDK
jgi:adenine-specific DNA-methyltransferase